MRIGVCVVASLLLISYVSEARAEDAGARVHMEATRENATLLRLAAAGVGYGSVGGRAAAVSFEQYEPICTAPCDAALDPKATYVVAGDGVTPSDKFRLPRAARDVRLDVKAGSAAARSWGWTSAITGLTGVILGGTFLVLDASNPKSNSATDSGSNVLKTVGYVGLGAGVPLLALGIVLVATSGTSVDVRESSPTPTGPELRVSKAISVSAQGVHF